MTIHYFETSALVKLLIQESGSDVASAVWDSAQSITTGRITYVEVRAALASAWRADRLDKSNLRQAKVDWEAFFSKIDIIEIHEAIVKRAGDLAEIYALRGYDAVHLACALALPTDSLVFVSWDQRLREAANSVGLGFAPINTDE